MTDVEDLLVRTLRDDRRAVAVPADVTPAVVRAAKRLQLRRRASIGAAGLVAVAAIAGGAMLVDGGSARDGSTPTYDASVSAQPRTS